MNTDCNMRKPTPFQCYAGIATSFILVVLVVLLLSACSEEPKSEVKDKRLTIKIVHGPEVRAYLAAMREAFLSTDPRVSDNENDGRGSKISIELISEMPIAAANRIASGDIKADAWLSPSTTVTNYANYKVHNLGAKQANCKTLFSTPVVVAARRDQLDKLGVSESTFSWSELFEGRLVETDRRDEESLITITHPLPTSSTSGIAALMQLYYLSSPTASSNQKEVALGLDQLSNSGQEERLRYYQSYVSGYGQSEGFLLSRAEKKESRRTRVVITTEQQVVLFNQQRLSEGDAGLQRDSAGRPLAPMIALYPQEGSYWENYSICESAADWVTPPQRVATQKFIDFISQNKMLAEARKYGFRPQSGEVSLEPPLTEAYGMSPSLPRRSFLPVSGEVLEKVLDDWPKIMRPAAFVLALDSSGSMEGEPLNSAKQQFRYLLAATTERDLKALVNFNTRPKLEAGLTESAEAVIIKLDPIDSLGGSSIYDSIRLATELIVANDLREYRKSIIVITDGDDKNSEISKQGLIDLISDKFARNDITLIVIAITGAAPNFTDLEEITAAANGIFKPTPISRLDEAFAEVLRNVQGLS